MSKEKTKKKRFTKEGFHTYESDKGRYVKSNTRPDGKPARKESEGETIDYEEK